MSSLPFAFASPAVLLALLALPAIWWLLRLTPPRPNREVFPPLRILASVLKRDETAAKSPWWLTLLRMLAAAAVVLAIANPVLNPRQNAVADTGPLVLIIDNGWTSAPDWPQRLTAANALLDDAEDRNVAVSLLLTADAAHDAVPVSADVARQRLTAASAQPLLPQRAAAFTALKTGLVGATPGSIVFMTDGIAESERDTTLNDLATLQPADIRLITDTGDNAIAVTTAANNADTMSVTLTRLNSAAAQTVPLTAYDSRGRAIGNGTATFEAGANTATGSISAPFELRNDFARIGIDGLSTAGATYLLDDNFRRRRVALLSGEVSDQTQPLLSPLYYINRALSPYADLIQPRETDLSIAVPELLAQKPSALIMADIGRLPEPVYGPVKTWIEQGGTLIRFAGPRLAGAPADDPLVPVTLRQGERALGGALSWSEPQPLADYPAASPFSGMAKPESVRVNRQVLAEPTPDLAERTWASLADGTPLVTTSTVGAGRIILFHVSAETSWSNLPVTGDFVEMLRRTVQLSRGSTTTGTATSDTREATTLAPYRLLNANGALITETGSARPLTLREGAAPVVGQDNPPGLYGSQDGFTALNLFGKDTTLRPLADAPSVVRETLAGSPQHALKPALLTTALLLMLIDTLIFLFLRGGLKWTRRAALPMLLLTLSCLLLPVDPTKADDSRPNDSQIMDNLATTHLAYVKTGESDVDTISERGLAGLTDWLTWRTTLEPAAPVGLDIASDELSFYPLIYWPISATAPMPSAEAVSRIEAYMRGGGTVLFDTRDQFSSLSGNADQGPNAERLQAILANLDIPPLEPVPPDHVLTKSFYLLNAFPGRYSGSPLWTESRLDGNQSQRSRSGDGVSPILITGNDFAGAWAIDAAGAPLLPTVPPDDVQREHAFRTGTNIMMYMLTGNYKADQVHVPALLERLGQ